jgi:hypothetical protein
VPSEDIRRNTRRCAVLWRKQKRFEGEENLAVIQEKDGQKALIIWFNTENVLDVNNMNILERIIDEMDE